MNPAPVPPPLPDPAPIPPFPPAFDRASVVTNTSLFNQGLHDHNDAMLYHLELGPHQLAQYLIRFSNSMKFTGTDPFVKFPPQLHHRVTNLILGISKPLLTLMIQQKLHEVHREPCPFHNLRLIKNYKEPVTDDTGLPQIYVLTVCTLDGTA